MPTVSISAALACPIDQQHDQASILGTSDSRATGASSLESRSPVGGRRVVALTTTIPTETGPPREPRPTSSHPATAMEPVANMPCSILRLGARPGAARATRPTWSLRTRTKVPPRKLLRRGIAIGWCDLRNVSYACGMKFFPRHRLAAVAAVALASIALTGSVASAAIAHPARVAKALTSTTTMHGTASVAYAGSLELWAATDLGPKFEAQTGDGFQGRAAGSGTLASEILANEIDPGVFMSVGKKNIKRLWPTKRSKFVIQLATDPLVVAYNPNGRFAKEFNAIADHKAAFSSLFTVMSSPGIRIGRTDPNADPQGMYFIFMMELAQSTLHLSFDPATTVLGVTKSTPFGLPAQMVDEDSLITDLQAGEFDATSAYLTQAIQYHLHYITLPPSLNFGGAGGELHYAKVSITLTGGTVEQGDLITLNITLVLPPNAKAAPSPANQAADNAFVAWTVSAAGERAAEKGRLPAHTAGLHRRNGR